MYHAKLPLPPPMVPLTPEMLLKESSTGCYDPPPLAEFSLRNQRLRQKSCFLQTVTDQKQDCLNYLYFSDIKHLQREEPLLKIIVDIYLHLKGHDFQLGKNFPSLRPSFFFTLKTDSAGQSMKIRHYIFCSPPLNLLYLPQYKALLMPQAAVGDPLY